MSSTSPSTRPSQSPAPPSMYVPKCPLCLTRLGPRDHVTAFCLTHPAHRRLRVSVPMHSPEDLLCPQCAGATPVDRGVFVAHVECAWKSPFWSAGSGRVEVPAGALSFLDAQTAQSVTVEHWEIEMLRHAATLDPELTAMVVPLELFLLASDPERRAMVRLVGPHLVGKTTLATMTASRTSYPDGDHGHAAPEDFVYVSPEARERAWEDFLKAAYASYMMNRVRRNAAASDLFYPTPSDHFVVRTSFLRRDGARPGEPAPGPRPRHRAVFEALRGATRMVYDVLAESSGAGPIAHAPRDTIAFYDSAGENNTRLLDVTLSQLETHMSGVAVLIDPTELERFGGSGDSAVTSLSEAVRHLELLVQAPRPCALVVTKVDLVRERLDAASGREAVEQLRRGELLSPAEARAVVRGWLDPAHPTERQLISQLAGTHALPVFLVWAEGLDGPAFPTGVGIPGFVDWCLDPDASTAAEA